MIIEIPDYIIMAMDMGIGYFYVCPNLVQEIIDTNTLHLAYDCGCREVRCPERYML
jgi:hypothetical protein